MLSTANSGRQVQAGMVFALLLAGVLPLRAQEALRMSLTSEQAARARRLANTTLGYYNLKAGPTVWRFASGLGLEWTDNIQLTGDNPLSDFIVRPEIDASMLWPMTEKNSVNLRLNGGYSAYVEHSGYSRFFVRPGSEVSFDIYTGNFSINLHDRFSILEDAYQDPTVVGNGDYARLENAVGTSLLWDLNRLLVRMGYDHVNYVSLNNNQSIPDGASEMLYASGGYRAGDFGVAGAELGGGFVDYQSALQADAVQWNAGLFGDTQVSEYLSLRASGGYMVYSPDDPRLQEDFSGFYLQVSARHKLNEFLRYDLSGGRTVNFAFYGGSVASWFARWSGSWNLLRKTTLSTYLEYQTGQELMYRGEQFDWVGGGFSLGKQLSRKLTASAGYQIHCRSSNLPSRNYTVNTVSLLFRYSF